MAELSDIRLEDEYLLQQWFVYGGWRVVAKYASESLALEVVSNLRQAEPTNSYRLLIKSVREAKA